MVQTSLAAKTQPDGQADEQAAEQVGKAQWKNDGTRHLCG